MDDPLYGQKGCVKCSIKMAACPSRRGISLLQVASKGQKNKFKETGFSSTELETRGYK